MFIFRVLNAVPYSNQPRVKDVIACLHSYFTCNLLLGCAILLSFKQFGGRPIECMTPLGFSGSWNEYAESYCFSSDTYFVSFDETIENISEEKKRIQHISYYQWMSFFLLFQAACFKFPTLLWKYFAGQSGMKVGEILRLATDKVNCEPNDRKQNIASLASHLQGALRFHLRLKRRNLTPHKIFRILNMKYSSYYVTCIYFISKIMFLLNSILQVWLLQYYLFRVESKDFGFNILHNLIKNHQNETWKDSGLFPRVTYCDFEVRDMGQSQNHTVQCVLILNIFTEKLFIVLWIWYVVLITVTFCNLISWIYTFLDRPASEHFIINQLEMSGERIFANEYDKGLPEILVQVKRFISKYLKFDGILILRLISQHADIVFTTELIYKLWEMHYTIERQRKGLKTSEGKWQKHLRRFEAIEEREMFPKFPEWINQLATTESIDYADFEMQKMLHNFPPVNQNLMNLRHRAFGVAQTPVLRRAQSVESLKGERRKSRWGSSDDDEDELQRLHDT